ncbi:MAG: hypothetical protein KAW46_11000 [candidate division Zixibacteria bacterium]|nr:hypothetical protein [candidate division Zixibacteria bacterium]
MNRATYMSSEDWFEGATQRLAVESEQRRAIDVDHRRVVFDTAAGSITSRFSLNSFSLAGSMFFARLLVRLN